MSSAPNDKIEKRRNIKLPFVKHCIDEAILNAYILSTLYNVAFFLQITILPYVSKELKCSDKTFGYIQTLSGLLQMIGSPVFGLIIQSYGLRKSLILCYFSTALSSIYLYYAQDVNVLAISRLPHFFMHGQQAHQALLAALTCPGKQRTKSFGRLGLTFGLGFVFIPLIEFLTSQFFVNEKINLITSVAISFSAIFLLISRMPHITNKHAEEPSDIPQLQKTGLISCGIFSSKIITLLRHRDVLGILAQKSAAILPAMLIFSVLQIYLINTFGLQAAGNSSLQLAIGLNMMFFNSIGISYLRSKFSESMLIRFGIIIFVITYGQFCWLRSLWMVWPIMLGITLAMSLVSTVIDSLLTTLVHHSDQGIVLGFGTSINSFIRTFSPLLAGQMLEVYGMASLGATGVIFALFALGIHVAFPIRKNLSGRNRRFDDENSSQDDTSKLIADVRESEVINEEMNQIKKRIMK